MPRGGSVRAPDRTRSTGWSRYSSAVTTPKLPPPPRIAQKRSGLDLGLVETRTLENQISHWCVFPSASHPCNRRSSSSPDEVPVRSSATVHQLATAVQHGDPRSLPCARPCRYT